MYKFTVSRLPSLYKPMALKPYGISRTSRRPASGPLRRLRTKIARLCRKPLAVEARSKDPQQPADDCPWRGRLMLENRLILFAPEQERKGNVEALLHSLSDETWLRVEGLFRRCFGQGTRKV